MTYQNLKQLAAIIKDSNEPFEIDLQEDKLSITTSKNSFWILLNIVGIAFSTLLLATYNRGQYNLELGLIFLIISIAGFWRMQNINKTLVLDIRQNEISIVPKFALQQLLFSKLLKVDTTLTFHTLPEMKIVLFRYFKYGWVYRIYYKQGIWTIYVLEFNKMETAQRVIDLLKS